MVKVGDEIEVKVLRVDAKDRKIGLTMKNVDDPTVPEDAEIVDEEKGKEPKKDLRGGTGAAGPLIQMPGKEE